MQCELKLQENQWSHNVWPEENKQQKPEFLQTIDMDIVRNKVIGELKKETILQSEFGIKISHRQIQNELDRLVQHSKDPGRLREMFRLFDNDPGVVAECIARPLLVDRLFTQSFNESSAVHKNIRTLALQEAKQYRQHASFKTLHATKQTVNYVLTEQIEDKSAALAKEQISDEKGFRIELEQDSFLQVRQKWDHQKQELLIKDVSDAYIYEYMLSETEKSIQTERLVWAKVSQHEWLKDQVVHLNAGFLPVNENFQIIKATNKKYNSVNKSTDLEAGFWDDGSMPRPRINHKAIWTGSEMIVVGGYEGSGNYVQSIHAYNPVTDSWRKVQTKGMPSVRLSPVVVWTGLEMIVYAGRKTDFKNIDDGALYNPLTDQWRAMATEGSPQGHTFSSAVWTGQELLLWGGTIEAEEYTLVNTGSRYNPQLDQWSSMSTQNAPVARNENISVWTGSEMIIWGGSFQNSDGLIFFKNGGRYNPTNNTWTTMATEGGTTSPYLAIWADNKMLTWAGSDIPAASYDPVTDQWSAMSNNNAPTSFNYLNTVWTGSKVIAWGGFDGGSGNSGKMYDPLSDVWTDISTLGAPSGRENHTAVWTGEEMIVWGGISLINGQHSFFFEAPMLNTGGRYNPELDQWVPTSKMNMPEAMSFARHLWTGNEMLVWGGKNKEGRTVQSNGVYNPATDTWRLMSGDGAPVARNNSSFL